MAPLKVSFILNDSFFIRLFFFKIFFQLINCESGNSRECVLNLSQDESPSIISIRVHPLLSQPRATLPLNAIARSTHAIFNIFSVSNDISNGHCDVLQH